MLERYLIEHCSPTLASVKTANLFTWSFAPEEMPSTNGPAIGFSKKVCSKKPDKDKAPPKIAAIRILGRRIFQIMLYSFVSVTFFKRMSAISDREIWTLPVLIFSTVITQNARIKRINTRA